MFSNNDDDDGDDDDDTGFKECWELIECYTGWLKITKEYLRRVRNVAQSKLNGKIWFWK